MKHVNKSVSSEFAERSHLLHRGVILERLTIAWNVAEALIAITVGIMAGSIALVGFGLDSTIETVSAVALYKRLKAELAGASEEEAERLERRALLIVGITFFILSVYILYEATTVLVKRIPPERSIVGICLATASLLVMPILAWAKIRVGTELGSKALIGDAKETFVCAYLSLALLVGLGLNALLGWWWADPAAALIMLPFIIHEGREALEEAVGGDE